jgi:hypothetical protein
MYATAKFSSYLANDVMPRAGENQSNEGPQEKFKLLEKQRVR